MQVGLSVYNIDAGDLVDLARAAEDAGFASLWLGEHVVLPVGYSSEHPTTGTRTAARQPIVDPATKLLDPLVALAACAAVTRRITLATGILLVPLRPPLLAARMVHTLHGLSAGRLVLGVGAGWLREEFEALGAPYDSRGRRLAESLQIMRAAWGGGPFVHRGEFFQLERLQLCEQPVHVPVIMGGNSDPALRRAARLGDGWFASGTPELDEACRLRERVLAYRAEMGPGGPFRLFARVGGADPGVVERYRAAGWDHVLVWADRVWPPGSDLEAKRASLAAAARALGLVPEPPARRVPA